MNPHKLAAIIWSAILLPVYGVLKVVEWWDNRKESEE